MSLFVTSSVRAVLIAGLLALALQACGRRGPPEAPPDPSVPAGQGQLRQRTGAAAGPGIANAEVSQASGDLVGEEDDGEESVVATPVGTPKPRSNAKRGYTIPKTPFILDPLL